MRRADRQMDPERALAALQGAYCGRLGTVSADGEPYVCPLLFVWEDNALWFHTTRATGHLARNLERDAPACFEVDAPGEAFAYGRFQCDTGLAYASVLVFGRVEVVDAPAAKAKFFDALMARYHPEDSGRPRGFYPRLDEVTVYVLRPGRITGKETLLPAAQARWPARDSTRSPDAVPPE
jgi:hypothetical protein